MIECNCSIATDDMYCSNDGKAGGRIKELVSDVACENDT